VWAQQTADGRYALVYNPSRRNRYPLVIVTGDDGVIFRDMRLVQGELPIQRYEGMHRSVGPQYVRGISHWSDDGSRAGEGAVWLVYSMSKEDIWVSRVPVPVRAEVQDGDDDESPAWNVYCPRWSSVTTDHGELRLEDRDPYDYAVATRVFAPRRDATVTFDVLSEQPAGLLDVDVLDAFDPVPVARLSIMPDAAGEWRSYAIRAERLHHVTFRTGPTRGVGGTRPVSPGTDRPCAPVAFRVRRLRLS
jgi:hypothetical protein